MGAIISSKYTYMGKRHQKLFYLLPTGIQADLENSLQTAYNFSCAFAASFGVLYKSNTSIRYIWSTCNIYANQNST